MRPVLPKLHNRYPEKSLHAEKKKNQKNANITIEINVQFANFPIS